MTPVEEDLKAGRSAKLLTRLQTMAEQGLNMKRQDKYSYIQFRAECSTSRSNYYITQWTVENISIVFKSMLTLRNIHNLAAIML